MRNEISIKIYFLILIAVSSWSLQSMQENKITNKEDKQLSSLQLLKRMIQNPNDYYLRTDFQANWGCIQNPDEVSMIQADIENLKKNAKIILSRSQNKKGDYLLSSAWTLIGSGGVYLTLISSSADIYAWWQKALMVGICAGSLTYLYMVFMDDAERNRVTLQRLKEMKKICNTSASIIPIYTFRINVWV